MAINVGDTVKICDDGENSALRQFVGREGVVINKAMGGDNETLLYHVALTSVHNPAVRCWVSRRMLAKLEPA